MSVEAIIAIGGLIIIGLTFMVIFSRLVMKKVPRKLKEDKFQAKWQELQSFCKDKATWPDAILAADKLLDEALTKRRFKGKNMGEKLVSAQKIFSNNDDVWFSHKLSKKIQEDPTLKLKEADVKDALLSLRQALKDLGAL
jgi:hypothetical protein